MPAEAQQVLQKRLISAGYCCQFPPRISCLFPDADMVSRERDIDLQL
jgi:hypothetical protein